VVSKPVLSTDRAARGTVQYALYSHACTSCTVLYWYSCTYVLYHIIRMYSLYCIAHMYGSVRPVQLRTSCTACTVYCTYVRTRYHTYVYFVLICTYVWLVRVCTAMYGLYRLVQDRRPKYRIREKKVCLIRCNFFLEISYFLENSSQRPLPASEGGAPQPRRPTPAPGYRPDTSCPAPPRFVCPPR